MAEQGRAADREYSDEAWSRFVGDVTPQHVGRLRRTYARFGRVYRDYSGLYWSHFYAALDWEDAEMWLEGAIQSKWSVSDMRKTRWQTTQGTRGEPPAGNEADLAEIADGLGLLHLNSDVRANSRETIDGPIYSAESTGAAATGAPQLDVPFDTESSPPAGPPRSNPAALDDPYAAWEDLPEDLARVVEEFKIVALRYKLEGWQEISQDRMRQILEGLIYLIQANSDGSDA
jgi:hypothetical protein